MTVINRYSGTERAAISFTGNTLGLLGTFNPSSAAATGNADGIGAFTTINQALQSPGGYPAGTTQTFTLNSSSAILTLLPGSTVLYAELIWSGVASNALQNVTTSLPNPINMTTPLGNTVQVSPDPATAQNSTNLFNLVSPYVRTANVTSIIQAAGAGTYTVAAVPCALGGNASAAANTQESNFVGWTLAVAYKNSALNYRNVYIWVMGEPIRQNTTTNVPISGFLTPPVPPLKARLALAVGSGDSYIAGDVMRFGPTTASLTTLSGPNNLSTNFFASQINNANSESATVGQLNTTGTFGTRNQTVGTKTGGVRQGWDVTNVDVSSTLQVNQTSAVAQFTTTGDVYYATAMGMQIDVAAPNLNPINKTVDKSTAAPGSTLNYTIAFQNSGVTTAYNAVFIDTIPSGTSFVPNSLVINGTPSASNPNPPGVSIGNLGPGQYTTITFSVLVNTTPNTVTISNTATTTFDFNTGTTTISSSSNSTTVNTMLPFVNITSTKAESKSFANIGDTIQYTVVLNLSSNTTVNNVTFLDTIPNGLSFVNGTLALDGTTISGANPNPPSGVNLGSLVGSGIHTVTFNAVVNTIPNPNPAVNTATTSLQYTTDPLVPNGSSANTSTNPVNLQVNNANLGNIVKARDKAFVTCGDIITYTISVPNSGNTTATNVILSDTAPNGTVFVPNSVLVNGVSSGATSPTNIPLGNILPGATTTVSFKVNVQC